MLKGITNSMLWQNKPIKPIYLYLADI